MAAHEQVHVQDRITCAVASPRLLLPVASLMRRRLSGAGEGSVVRLAAAAGDGERGGVAERRCRYGHMTDAEHDTVIALVREAPS